MSLYDKAFWWCLFFLAGVLLASFSGVRTVTVGYGVIAAVVSAAIFFFSGEKRFIPISAAIIIGSSYYVFQGMLLERNTKIPFDEKMVARALVMRSSLNFEGSQYLTVSLEDPLHGKIRITVSRYPEYQYGDLVEIKGVPERPFGTFARYLGKEGITGVMHFPELRLIETGKGFLILRALSHAKEFSEHAMRSALPPEKAAFLAGITLGETGGFSREFKKKLQATGTSHIVALSGYNISVILGAAFLFFGVLGRKRAIFASGVTVCAFVVMTGAEASVVRAAIMAGVVVLAESSRRIYSFRNAIVVTAAIMVLINPKVLAWDVGFQLSFAAMMGIVLLKPAILACFRIDPRPGFLGFRENFFNTISAEIAVLPILLTSFGTFSVLGAVVNMLVLAAIPTAMALGFVLVGSALVSPYLAAVVGWGVEGVLDYAMWVISFFSRLAPQIQISEFGFVYTLIFYGGVATFIFFVSRKHMIVKK
ncbi:MAG: ComEC/Rec2 family competence protein [Patescibacteria group bacterium]